MRCWPLLASVGCLLRNVPDRQPRGAAAAEHGCKQTIVTAEAVTSWAVRGRLETVYPVHAGILNVMVLVLVCANARLIVENLMKYGILLNPARWFALLLPDGVPPLMQLCHWCSSLLARLLRVPGLHASLPV